MGCFTQYPRMYCSFKSVLEVDFFGAEDELRSCKRVKGNLEKRKLAWRTGGRNLVKLVVS